MEIPLTVHPAALAPGSLVGSWRLLAFASQGSYGWVFRAERAAQPDAGSFALKLARQPGDPRFALEVELLARIQHPNVPRLHDFGEWTGPEAARFPFLVMDWVDGLPLYAWGRLQPLSSREVLRLLAQVARALQATHAAGGLHRDVKGDNVLVRPSDGHAFLVDFGSCTWRGAPVLTRQSHPPGTTHYWSPQAQLHHWKFRRRPSAHYTASEEDDVYSLGVMAYRLVAGRYPLIVSTSEEEDMAGLSRFPALVPVENLAQVSTELARWIGQMLSEQPTSRGSIAEVALGLELAADKAGRDADLPISSRQALKPGAPPEAPRPEVPEAPRRGAPEVPRRGAPEAPRHGAPEAPPVPARQPIPWRRWLAEAAGSVAVAVGVWSLLHALEGTAPADVARANARASEAAAQARETGGLGELALTELLSTPVPLPMNEGIAVGLPKEPLPGQRVAPCKKPERELNGGCWLLLGDETPPCILGTYEWKNQCYWPSFGPPRPATSEQR